MRTYLPIAIPLAVLGITLCAQNQQNPPAHHKVLTPQQHAYQQQLKVFLARQQRLRAQAKTIFDVEMAREKADLCANAGSTHDSNVCYEKQIEITDGNLKSFEAVMRDLSAPEPQMPGEPADPNATAAHVQAEFDNVEQLWRHYRETACAAAFHQFGWGSGGPSFEMECQLRLARDHMRELRMIYGESFL